MIKRSYAIIGTGAVGGFYGSKLQKAGFDVHFLLKSDAAYVQKNGLIIESKDGDFTLPEVQAYSDVKNMPKCDVILVALKTTNNYLLPEILPSLLKDDSTILVFQNGLGSEAEIEKIVNRDSVTIMGGLCFVCCHKVGPGKIVHLDYGFVSLGEYKTNYQPIDITANMMSIGEDLKMSGIAIELFDNLLLARWKKLVWNIPYNGLSVVLNAQTNALMSNDYTRTLVKKLMWEVLAGAASCHCIIPDSFVGKMLEHTDNMKPYRTSMKLDYDAQRPLEVEAIFGYPLRMATEAGANLPLISMLYQQLKFLDAVNQMVK